MADELAADIVSAKSDYAAEQKAAAEQAAAEEKAAKEAAAKRKAAEEKAAQEAAEQEEDDQEVEDSTEEKDPPKKEENQPEESDEDEDTDVPTSASGAAIVNYAMQFVGGRYVWGGSNLSTGVDCSGFVMCLCPLRLFSAPQLGGPGGLRQGRELFQRAAGRRDLLQRPLRHLHRRGQDGQRLRGQIRYCGQPGQYRPAGSGAQNRLKNRKQKGTPHEWSSLFGTEDLSLFGAADDVINRCGSGGNLAFLLPGLGGAVGNMAAGLLNPDSDKQLLAHENGLEVGDL